MILRLILAVTVAIMAVLYYRDKPSVPTFCVATVAASLMAQVLVAKQGNLLPLVRAWLIGGALAVLVYPIDLFKTDAFDVPTGYCYAAALIGCLVAGFWSLAEGRSFWDSRCISATSDNDENGAEQLPTTEREHA